MKLIFVLPPVDTNSHSLPASINRCSPHAACSGCRVCLGWYWLMDSYVQPFACLFHTNFDFLVSGAKLIPQFWFKSWFTLISFQAVYTYWVQFFVFSFFNASLYSCILHISDLSELFSSSHHFVVAPSACIWSQLPSSAVLHCWAPLTAITLA